MSRKQIFRSPVPIAIAAPNVPQALSSTDIWVKSFIVQSGVANTDFIFIGDSANQSYGLEPRRSLKVWGDDMDNGGSALINLASVYVQSPVAGQLLNLIYLEGN